MASDKEYMEFVLEQLSDLESISYRAMMGEYIIYYHGTVIGGVYDNRFLLKYTRSVQTLLPEARLELPYDGAKAMLLADVDDKEQLHQLLNTILADLKK